MTEQSRLYWALDAVLGTFLSCAPHFTSPGSSRCRICDYEILGDLRDHHSRFQIDKALFRKRLSRRTQRRVTAVSRVVLQ